MDIFGRGILVVDKICGVDLIKMVEELRWLGKRPKIYCGYLMHLIEFADVSCNFRRFGQYRGHVFARLDMI